MKKLVLLGLITIFLIILVGTGTAMAKPEPGPWKSQSGKVEEIPYGDETLLKLYTGDGGFQLWITGDREWHCVYKPADKFGDKPGWSKSVWAPGFVYKCNVLFE